MLMLGNKNREIGRLSLSLRLAQVIAIDTIADSKSNDLFDNQSMIDENNLNHQAISSTQYLRRMCIEA